jgi:hypothetical protein
MSLEIARHRLGSSVRKIAEGLAAAMDLESRTLRRQG